MNRWSLKIAEPLGIGVYVHGSFLLIVAWVALLSLRDGGGLAGVVSSLIFLAALFACVVLHELGHAMAAARFGIRTRDITLLPIGGLARLERLPEKPVQELVVAVAGPLVNVAIAIALGVWITLTGSLGGAIDLTFGSFVERLLAVNIALVLFNMLPAFPMDGGRVLRALLAMRLGALRATRIAATVGKAMAALFAVVGLFYNPFLLLIAFFIWAGASQERAMAEARARRDQTPWGPVIDVSPVSPQDRLRVAELAAGRARTAAESHRLLDELRRRQTGR